VSVYSRDAERMTDAELLAYLTATSELYHEVADWQRSYNPYEWAGVARQEQIETLRAACWDLVGLCADRNLDWYAAYWGGARPAVS
jgi:hypothetical protein